MLCQEIINVFEQKINQKQPCPTCQKHCSHNCVDCLDYYSANRMDYSCENLRFAYVLRYFFANKGEIKKLLRRYSQHIIDHLALDNRTNSICYVGIGLGPGSDFTAFTEWLTEASLTNLRLVLIRVDNEDDWNTQFFLINDIYNQSRQDIGLSVEFRKIIDDGLSITFNSRRPEIISISYFLSEYLKDNSIQNVKSKIDVFWSHIRGVITDKSLIILNDRPQDVIAELMTYFANKVVATFPQTVAKEDCFTAGYGNYDGSRFCESNFGDDFQQRYRSRRWCSSYQTIIFVKK